MARIDFLSTQHQTTNPQTRTGTILTRASRLYACACPCNDQGTGWRGADCQVHRSSLLPPLPHHHHHAFFHAHKAFDQPRPPHTLSPHHTTNTGIVRSPWCCLAGWLAWAVPLSLVLQASHIITLPPLAFFDGVSDPSPLPLHPPPNPSPCRASKR